MKSLFFYVKIALISALLAVMAWACNNQQQKEEAKTATAEKGEKKKAAPPKPKLAVHPALFTDTLPYPAHNPLSEAGVELGRKLFYDPSLSKTGTVACATCHQQSRAFSDGLDLSTQGISGNRLNRHSPALVNLAWTPALFWDGGATNLESLMFGPLTHKDEMGANLEEMVAQLNEDEEYRAEFKAVFGDDKVESAYVARALAQFVRTLISGDSRFDRQMRRQKPGMDTEELAGYRLFNQNCSMCHSGMLFTDNQFHNIGLDLAIADTSLDQLKMGRWRISHKESDRGSYKTPTLRNIALTAPYMHDGRFKTLEEVLEFYNTGVQAHPNLSPFMKSAGYNGIRLSDEESALIIKFLHSLTDSNFVNNPAYGAPKEL